MADMRGLYLITDQGAELLHRVQQAIRGGVRTVQYRNKDTASHSYIETGRSLRELCRNHNVTFIVNDDVAFAKELDADGVHIGQDDGDCRSVRQAMGKGKLIGISTHSLDEALNAERDGADYIGFGAMYPTSSKDIQHLVGPQALSEIRSKISIPIVAIGGILRDNAVNVIDAGADSIAIISGVLSQRSPAIAARELSLLFNRCAPYPTGNVLTVAGSDSGGGAGIQADIKTVSLLGSYCAAAITALTAQNTNGVSGVHGVDGPFVAQQLDAVLGDIAIDVVKTGMLYSADVVHKLVEALERYDRFITVVDPVMTAKGGANLLQQKAAAALRERLLPLSYLITPNIPEAEGLTGTPITTEGQMKEAAIRLHELGARNVLIKGGHLPGPESVDILFDGVSFTRYPAARVESKNTHGTGCTFASAIATFLAQGEPLPMAVKRAKDFITAAIATAKPLGRGHGPINHFEAARKIASKIDPPA